MEKLLEISDIVVPNIQVVGKRYKVVPQVVSYVRCFNGITGVCGRYIHTSFMVVLYTNLQLEGTNLGG